MRETISVENMVAISLQRLGIGNTLCTVGEVFGVAEKYDFIDSSIFCWIGKFYLQGTFMQISKSNPVWGPSPRI